MTIGVKAVLIDFIKDESGATAIEYALLAALIGIGIVGGATALRDNLDGTYRGVGTALEDATDDLTD